MLTSTTAEVFSLDDFMLNPLERKEWVDGQLVEKDGMTLRHSGIEARLTRYWGNYLVSGEQGGQVYTEAPSNYKAGPSSRCSLSNSRATESIF